MGDFFPMRFGNAFCEVLDSAVLERTRQNRECFLVVFDQFGLENLYSNLKNKKSVFLQQVSSFSTKFGSFWSKADKFRLKLQKKTPKF